MKKLDQGQGPSVRSIGCAVERKGGRVDERTNERADERAVERTNEREQTSVLGLPTKAIPNQALTCAENTD